MADASLAASEAILRALEAKQAGELAAATAALEQAAAALPPAGRRAAPDPA